MATSTHHQRDMLACLRIAQWSLEDLTIDLFLEKVLELSIEHLDADRGSIFVHEAPTNHLRGLFMTGVERPSTVILQSQEGLAGHCFSTGESLTIPDAYEDPRFFRGVDQQTGYRTRAVLVVPLRTAYRSGDIVGVLEVLNPKNRGTFSEEDCHSLEYISTFAGIRIRELSTLSALLANQESLKKEIAIIHGYDSHSVLHQIIGRSPPIEKLKQLIWNIAPFDSSVLIIGESGTGKERVAQSLHSLSKRSKGPFIAINCAAIPESLMEAELFGIESGVATGVTKRIGKIEQANGGTLFLDEIGEMPLAMQAKLLRVLQEREILRVGGKNPVSVDVRVLAATHVSLAEAVTEKRFREDLLYRVRVVELQVPPLRERRDDIPILIEEFLRRIQAKYGSAKRNLSPMVLTKLQNFSWPGNVRQLENEAERLFILSGSTDGLILPEHLSPEICPDGVHHVQSGVPHEEGVDLEEGRIVVDIREKPLATIITALEHSMVKAFLTKHHGNKTKVAEALGISREGLRKMLIRFDDASLKPE